MVRNRKADVKKTASTKNFGFEPKINEFSSPRPTPFFFFKEQTFSTKKERTPRENPPPTPRPRTSLKSCPPVSRLFSHTKPNRAQSVSFIESQSKLSTKHYNQNLNQLYFNQCFDIVSKLGSGSFGDVFEVKCKEDERMYAVKRSKERFRGKSDRLRKLEEVKKHEQLPKHPNCVGFCKAWEEKEHLYIQTELCKTSLSQYSEENHDIPEKTVWNYLVDLLLAVKHLHDHDLIHLDIKPENIFISEDGICKLGDFGLVLDVSKGNVNDALEGDPKYLAPELMQGIFTKAADVFSLGITILELACDLDLPRGDTTWHQLRQRQIPTQFTKRLSPSLTEVICRMMEPNFKTRPTVDDILQSAAVQKMYKRRMHLLKFNSVAKYLRGAVHWLVLFCCWVKSFWCRLFPFLHKKNESITTPVRSEPSALLSYCDYSFSDEEVFEPEDVKDVCTVLFKDDKALCDLENIFPESPVYSEPLRRMPSPSSFSYRQLFPDDGSPTFKGSRSTSSPVMRSSSVRRSPRLAAKLGDGTNDALPLINVAPRNLLAEFDKEVGNDNY